MAEEAKRLLATRASRAAARKLVNNGEAATIAEAYQLQAARAREARRAKYTDKEITQIATKAGLIGAIKHGKRTNYPGVIYHKAGGKWQVRFSNKGKRIHVGMYASEIEAAEAHDKYVRAHGLKRPLNFPRAGEESSQSITLQAKSVEAEDN